MFLNFLTKVPWEALWRNLAVVAVVLGVMIFVHELGHFIAAKWFSVRVLTFSLGFGKRLFGFKRGETDYRLSALPLGGYVKMAGEEPSENQVPEPNEFQGRPRWQRFVVMIMGPTMNIVMAVAVLTGIYRFHDTKIWRTGVDFSNDQRSFLGSRYEGQPARVGAVEPGSPASQAGLKPGDVIVQIENTPNPRWEDLATTIMTSAGKPLRIRVLRDNQHLDLKLTPKGEEGDETGYPGLEPYEPAVIQKVEPGFPAARAGLRPGDEIVGFNGQPCYSFPAIAEGVQSAKGKEVDLTIRRQGSEFHVHLVPVQTELGRPPLKQAFTAAIESTIRSSLLTVDILSRILTGRMSAKSLSGPIGIAQVSGAAYQRSFVDLLMIVSFISLQLGILNLLPIPILDGGAILLLLIESVIRRNLSLAFKERFVQVGMVFLLFLAVFVMYNDIMKIHLPQP